MFSPNGFGQTPAEVIRYAPPQTVPVEPHETPVEMPPVSGVWSEPAEPSAPTVVVRDRFTSIQVNVDPYGDNEWNDAANEPSIAIDPTNPDRMAIGWRHFSTIESSFRQAGVAFSDDGGFTWYTSDSRVLDFGQFRSDPVLAADNDGVFYYSSLSSLRSVELFTSFDGGLSWPRVTSAFGGDKQWLTVDRTDGPGAGHLYQIWNAEYSCCAGADFARSVDGGASFEQPVTIPAVPNFARARPKWGTIDVGVDGSVYLVGSSLDQTSHVFARSVNAQDASVSPTFDLVRMVDLGGVTTYSCPPNPGGMLGQVWVASDHSQSPTRGNIYVLGSVEPSGVDPLDVHLIRSEDGGATWSRPIRINDDPLDLHAHQWFGTLAVAPNGRIDVVWNDTRNAAYTQEPTVSELFYSYSLDGGETWSENEAVTPPFDPRVGYPRQQKLGDYYHMVSDSGGASLAYAATFNGEQDVYFVRLTPDCNGNGMPDELDIVEGVSEDCNVNMTPDECERDTDCDANGIRDTCEVVAYFDVDCNFNGIPDACDIADGLLADRDHNGVPDECECDVDPVELEVNPVEMSRYLAIVPGNLGRFAAMKVTLTESELFPQAVGASWWIGDPKQRVDSEAFGTSMTVAGLSCEPVYRDWGDLEVLYVFGAAIVPEATYEIRVIRDGCRVGDPVSYSMPTAMTTGLWGDVVEPFAVAGETAQPDFLDVAAIVRTFLDDANSVVTPQADLYPAVPDQMIDFQDIGLDVGAFTAEQYPFDGPTTCSDPRLQSPSGLKKFRR